jgi:DNA-binding MarR family transcriptional regulator
MHLQGLLQSAPCGRSIVDLVNFKLRNHLAYLLNRVGFLTRDNMSSAIAEYGVTLQMWRVLASLYCEGEETITGLVPHTSLEQSTVSRTVSALHARKLVTRRSTKNDGRMVVVGLTAKGRALTEKIIPHALDSDEILTAGISEEDIGRLRVLFQKLYDNMQRTVEERQFGEHRRSLDAS